MNIILDTNIYRNDLMLRSGAFKTFIDYLQKTKATLVIPLIVIEELCFLYDNEIHKRKKELEIAVNNYNKISIDTTLSFIRNEIKSETPLLSYKNYFLEQLCIMYIEIPYKDEYLKELVKRAIQKIKPCSSKGEEFRDSILWLITLDYITEHYYDKCVFISANIKDFADDCGKNLHPELIGELNKKSLKLNFYTTLHDFNKTYTVKIDFITLEWLTENVDWNRLNQEACKEGNIHCSYFFELYERKATFKESLEYYEIINAHLDKGINDLCIYEDSDDNYTVEIYLSGIVETIFFIKEDEHSVNLKSKKITANFWTQTRIKIKNKSIIEYSDEYFEEESALNFY